ncbi:suppressor of tub2 mutation [Coemansia spiralis]|nr:suppressor of tub2 mutation [Coemansia spiralis]
MGETLDQLWRPLQSAQTLGLEAKAAALDRLRDGLEQGAGGSVKALDGIVAVLAQTLGSSQVIACQAALGCVQPLVEYAAREAGVPTMKQLLRLIVPQLVDRLGDGRMVVRELALSTLAATWSELAALHGQRVSLDGGSGGPGASGIQWMGTTPSPVQAQTQWSAVHTFERDMQTQGLGHKTWRVREMALEWLIACTEQFGTFPVLRYVPDAFALLDDNQEAVRFASKRALNTIYHARPDLQAEIVARARTLAAHRPTVLAAITAPKDELAAAAAAGPASPYGGSGARSMSRMGASHVGRPRSRASTAPRADSRLGAFGGVHAGQYLTVPSVPPLPAAAGIGGLRSVSQMGQRPGFATPRFPARSSGASDRRPLLSPHSGAPASLLPRPGSSLNSRRGVPDSGASTPAQRLPSSAQAPLAFVPSHSVPADVKVHHVPSKASLASEFTRTVGVFAGRETEANWIQRERAVGVYRGIVWGNAAVELRDELVAQLKEHMHQILQAVGSLRTSLSAYAMGLCDDVAVRLGPHAAAVFDPIADALLKQCAQTKKIGALRAAQSLATAFQRFPLRARGIEKLQLRISEKSAVLRLAVVTTCTSALRSHGPRIDPADRRWADVLAGLSAITRIALTDAQPSVREPARQLFWALHAVSEAHAAALLEAMPDSVTTALDRDRPMHASGTPTGAGGPQYSPERRPTSVAAITRTPSGARPPRMRSSFGGASHTPPHRLLSADQVDLYRTRAEAAGDAIVFADPLRSQKPRARLDMLRSPAKARMSLGLIDFASMEIKGSLLDIGTPPKDAPTTSTGAASSPAEDPGTRTDLEQEQELELGLSDDGGHGESQATAVATEPPEAEGEDEPEPLFGRASCDSGAAASPGLRPALTPDRTPPTASPSLRSVGAGSSSTSVATYAGQLATPRTQSARYWHGPLEPALPPPSLPAGRAAVPESPMGCETPAQRLDRVEAQLQRLAENQDVNEALFRSLARFAKEESSTQWVDAEHGGRAYLDRVLGACLGWLQSPAGGRDAVFIKDSCFDVLRVLVRRRSQHFSLPSARMLLLEVLRNRFFESTILSGSAEDVFYDMAAHLGADLCFELAEDFFQRAPLPAAPGPDAHAGYAALQPPRVPTPHDADPMGVFAMDNALAGVLEFAAEAVRRLPASDTVGPVELRRFMPYSVVCFVHPRSQVRKAALEPIIAVHERLGGGDDADLEDLLLRAGPDRLAASANPLAPYIAQIRRPELRRLVWTFHQSRRQR